MAIKAVETYCIYQKAWLYAVLSVFLCLCPVDSYCQSDTIHTLKGVEVGYKAPAQGVTANDDGSYTVSASALRRGIRALGEADALAAVSMMPGVSAGSDYSSGMSIDGCDYAHNVYTLDGGRVFFPYHFGGIFSTFNTNHISKLNVDATHRGVSVPGGLGGMVSAVTSDAVPERVGGIANVGLMASSATLSVPAGGSTAVLASVRASYLNMLYGSLLQTDDSRTRYSFEDYNLTVTHRCGDRGVIKATGFYNTDRLGFDDDNFTLTTSLRWHNALAALSYAYDGDRVSSSNTLAFSTQGARLGLSIAQFSLSMPSSVSQSAASGTFDVPAHGVTLGYRAEYTHFDPQSVTSQGLGIGDAPHRTYDAGHMSLGVSKCWRMGKVDFGGNIALAGDVCDDYRHMAVDAAAYVRYFADAHLLSLNIGTYTQSMHNVGFSDIGLASNFYMPVSQALPVERAYGADVNYRWHSDGSHLSAGAKVFWRRLLHCPEYEGDVLGLMTGEYDPMQAIVESDGFNTGADLVLNYDYGAFSGWGGYSLAVCRRKFADMSDRWVPSATEPLHSFKALVQWRLSPRIDLSAYFVVASGRRYTPVEAIFIVGGNVLTEYGIRNSANLPLYHRLDLSATLRLPRLRLGPVPISSYVNVSVLNAYGHSNVEMQYFTYNDKDHTIKLRQVQSLYRFLPSVSYTVEF